MQINEASDAQKILDKARGKIESVQTHLKALENRSQRPSSNDEKRLICQDINEATLNLRLAIQWAEEQKRYHNREVNSWSNWQLEARKVEVELSGLQDRYIPPTKPL